jgi:HSP20 family protein
MVASKLMRRPGWAALPFNNRFRALMEDPFFRALDEPLGETALRDTIGWTPAVDVKETDDEYVFKVELPGLKRENITIAWEKDVLTIRGEKVREEKADEGKLHLYERAWGEFLRTFTFPMAVLPEKIAAEMADGVLTVKVPKAPEAKKATRKIEIRPV